MCSGADIFVGLGYRHAHPEPWCGLPDHAGLNVHDAGAEEQAERTVRAAQVGIEAGGGAAFGGREGDLDRGGHG